MEPPPKPTNEAARRRAVARAYAEADRARAKRVQHEGADLELQGRCAEAR